MQDQALFGLREFSEVCRILDAVDVQQRAGGEVGGLVGSRDESTWGAWFLTNGFQHQPAFRAAGVVQMQDVIVVAAAEPLPGHRQRNHAGFGRVDRVFRRSQPCPCRGGFLPKRVPGWPEFHDARPGFKRAGPQLWSPKVHSDQAGSAGRFCRLFDMLCHGAPCLGIVVRTVDACDVHTAFHQLANQVGIGRSRGGQRDHDAGYAIDRLWAQQLLRSAAEQFRAVLDASAG